MAEALEGEIDLRIKQSTVPDRATRTGAPVDDDGRFPAWVATRFPVHVVAVADLQPALLFGLDLRVQFSRHHVSLAVRS
jgi:hypothetical protein